MKVILSLLLVYEISLAYSSGIRDPGDANKRGLSTKT